MRARLQRLVDERNALPLGIAAALLAALGDALTAAEIAFTLVYLVPVALVTWFRGRRAGLGMVAFCVASSAFTDFFIGPPHAAYPALFWNLFGEALIFFLFSYTMASLRERIKNEMTLRLSALEELRHAERLNTIGKLAAGVAHELGTPLNVIAGRAEMIATGRGDPAATKRHRDTARKPAPTLARDGGSFARACQQGQRGDRRRRSRHPIEGQSVRDPAGAEQSPGQCHSGHVDGRRHRSARR
jgi:signal transduction histidine kinase